MTTWIPEVRRTRFGWAARATNGLGEISGPWALTRRGAVRKALRLAARFNQRQTPWEIA